MGEATLKGGRGFTWRARVGAVILAVVTLVSAAKADGFGMTPEQFWHDPFGVNDWIPFVADVDGDGRADLVALQTGGDGNVAVARTSAIGKPLGEDRVLTGFGKDAVAAACVPVVKGAPPAFVGIFGDGSVRVGTGYDPGTRKYKHDDLALKLPAGLWVELGRDHHHALADLRPLQLQTNTTIRLNLQFHLLKQSNTFI